MKDIATTKDSCLDLLQRGREIEEIISFLRQQGLSKVQSMLIITQVCELSMEKAKHLVHYSSTWSDVKEGDEKFHEKFLKSIE